MSENVSLQVDSNQAPVVQQVQQQTVHVPLVMLENIKNILDICGNRATFKTSEMYGVGLTYNELSKLISESTNNNVKSV